VRDGVALLAILARVRRRLRAIAALEGAAIGAALALAALACGLALTRWRTGGLSSPLLPLWLGAAGGLAGAGAVAGALRKIPFERCARLVDAKLGGHDRLLSALAFHQDGNPVAGFPNRRCDGNPGRVPKPSRARSARPSRAALDSPFVVAAIADAVARGGAVAPAEAVPLRHPRATPAFAAAATLVAVVALAPFPARGSRRQAPPTGAGATAPAATATARVRLSGRALDPERDQAAAALLAARALGDGELGALARELAATVKDLAAQGLDQSDLLDRLADLQRRADDAAAEVTGLRQGLERAGRALRGAPATRESGRALEAQDGPATETSLNDLAAEAAAASAGDRNRIAGTFDKAGERARAGAGGPTDESQARSSSVPSPSRSPSQSSAGAGESTTLEESSSLAPGADPRDEANEPAEERQRRLARDDPHAARPNSGPSSPPRAPRERRLQRLGRELGEAAAACRTDPEACRRKLQSQARELPRMEDEARRLAPRQHLAEAVRQMRERMRREGSGGGGGERAREERRFLRAARGESHPGEQRWEEDPGGAGRLLAENPDGPSGEGDDSDDGVGDDSSGNEGWAQSGGGDGAAAGAASDGQKGDGEGGTGDGIGSQKGADPLGERGAMTTRGHAREAQVRNGAGPTRSQVIQSAARRGFAHATYQGVYTDYQAAVEESLDASAVPPGRRYIVKRYFQLIRPQSSRAPR
jgi:hypothetical protein